MAMSQPQRKIAKYIVEARAEKPIETTLEFAAIVRRAIGRKPGKIDLATKTFQAIRIWVKRRITITREIL
jgi:16S rRNA (cytosine1402-N4)-methyltransferase